MINPSLRFAGAALAMLVCSLCALFACGSARADGGAIWTVDDAGKPTVRVPAALAYGYPDREAIQFSDDSVTQWSDSHQSLVWYGELKQVGTIKAILALRLPVGAKATLRLTVTPGGIDDAQKARAQSVTATAIGAGTPAFVSFPAMSLNGNTGWTRFTLTGIEKSGATFGDIMSLTLSGSAIEGAFFNTTHYRSTASVHLGYHPPADLAPIDAFYTEVTARRDPVVTYYCAIGWSRGYMGYQVNSPTERRIIFSVWDAGNEKTDKNAVAGKDRAQWMARGPGVFTDRFGNEGTGGHSHLVYPWKNGETYRFCVTGQPDGPDHVIYAGYFYFPEKHAWGLIGKMRAPTQKPGESAKEAALHGLYSFDEDFSGAAGDKRRLAEFGPQWAHTADGKWHEVLEAHFSNTDRKREQRDDYDAFPTPDGRAFALATGGYVAPHAPIDYGDSLKRTSTGYPPADLDELLAHLPTGETVAAGAQ